jgi:hypothetical protein
VGHPEEGAAKNLGVVEDTLEELQVEQVVAVGNPEMGSYLGEIF